MAWFKKPGKHFLACFLPSIVGIPALSSEELLEEGVDIDLKGRYRRTAFAEAHLRGHFAVSGPSWGRRSYRHDLWGVNIAYVSLNFHR